MPIIECQGVSKSFVRSEGPQLLRERLAALFHRRRTDRFYALKNISFQVEAGESLAVIGRNGAGKSTLLGLVSGLARPDTGSVTINGRVTALLELGSGFHPSLTGRENVFLNAALLGYTERDAHRLFDQIVDFSGIGEFIDQPLRTYSSGMSVRLAFSIAVHGNPDILIVDEVLAVGDAAFGLKCLERIHELREQGKTFICVSHSRAAVQQLCDRAIWLDHGELVLQGEVNEVLEAYEGHIAVGA